MGEADVASSFWFQALSWFLAAAMYTLLGRFVLSHFLSEDNQMVFWRVFVQITDPIVKLVRFITPLFVVDHFVALLAAAWMLILRLVLAILALMSVT